jgi:hypothetical protein
MANIGLNLDHAVQRVGDYWEQDGLPTLMLALLCLAGGSLAIWMPHYHSFRRDLPTSVLQLLLFGAFIYFVARKNSPVIQWLKARITYPRTGYVALPPRGSEAAARIKGQAMKRHPEIWMIGPLAFSAVVDTPWFGTGLAIIATSIMWAITRGKFPSASILIPGFYLSALLLPFLHIAPDNRFPYFYLAFGLLYLLAGIIQLVGYLRRHPVVQA